MTPLLAPILDGMSDDEWIAVINGEIGQEDSVEWLFAPLVVDDSQLELDLFDYDEAAQELEDARMDEEWIRGGC